MTIKLLTEHHLEFLRLKKAAQACQSLHLSIATFLEITCRGSINIFVMNLSYHMNQRKILVLIAYVMSF